MPSPFSHHVGGLPLADPGCTPFESRLHQAAGEGLAILNGKAGVELPEVLRAGAVGIIPGGESYDILAGAYDDLTRPDGDPARGEAAYREVLPLLICLMDWIDHFLLYGNRVLSYRFGTSCVDPRVPFGEASAFGLDPVRRHADAIGPP